MAVRPWLDRFAEHVVTIDAPTGRELAATRILLDHPRQPVLFRDLDGAEAAGNVWSTRDRVASALEVPRDELFRRIADAQAHPRDPRVVERAPFQKHASTDVDLLSLPVPKLFPKDAGRYITAGVWVAEWQGMRNLSFHRIQLLGRDRGVCRIVPRHLRHMYNEAMEAGQELRVAVCIGLDPWNLLAGGTSVEYGVDETRIASALTLSCLRRPVDVVRTSSGLTVPADAEYVLEGRLIAETHDEGPFVDAVRTYDRVRKEPVLVVDRISQRDDPIFHIIVGGLDEHFMFMGMPREPVIYQAVARAVPHVKAVRLTEGGSAWLHGVVSIRKQHQGDGKNAIMAAFGAHTSMKQVTIVDEDIDIFDDRDVEWAVATRFQADRGLVVLHDVRGSSIDPSARDGFTSKLGIDATKPIGGDPAMFDKATLQ
ncbi:MAG TPA: UbiD family decarboxylase [Thermoplasmata archaeon]|nr:UbiD family decarboxylase [Thermoplasmata archaeon]